MSAATDFRFDHYDVDYHVGPVEAEPIYPTPIVQTETICLTASGNQVSEAPKAEPDTTVTSALPFTLEDIQLAMYARTFDDLQKSRVATGNRIWALLNTFKMPETAIEVVTLQAACDGMKSLEDTIDTNMRRELRKHPLYPWAKRQRGLGQRQFARFLGEVPDPYWNTMHNRPRTLAELRAHCGYHVLHPGQNAPENHKGSAGVAPFLQRGVRANWEGQARKCVFAISESYMKNGDEHRAIYLDARYKYADALHQRSCVRCGPRGNPKPAGSPLSDGHKHARALRMVSRAFLEDVWKESRRLHEEAATSSPRPSDDPEQH